MEVRFDFERDERFIYAFDQEFSQPILEATRDLIKIKLSHLWDEIEAYGGIVTITLSDKIDILKEMGIPVRDDWNDDLPLELRAKIFSQLSRKYWKSISTDFRDLR